MSVSGDSRASRGFHITPVPPSPSFDSIRYGRTSDQPRSCASPSILGVLTSDQSHGRKSHATCRKLQARRVRTRVLTTIESCALQEYASADWRLGRLSRFTLPFNSRKTELGSRTTHARSTINPEWARTALDVLEAWHESVNRSQLEAIHEIIATGGILIQHPNEIHRNGSVRTDPQ